MRVIAFVFAIALAWASYYTVTHRDARSAMAWGALAVLAVAASLQFYLAITRAFGPTLTRRSREVVGLLKNAIGQLIEKSAITNHPTHVSMHVWMVPVGYRLVFPYRVRKWLKSLFSTDTSLRLSLKPALRRVGTFSLGPQQRSGVTFRKGYGLIGRCLAANTGDPIYVDFEDATMKRALQEGESRWRERERTVTHALKYEDAVKIGRRYGQAMAIVVRDPSSGEAIGVLTIESRKCCTDKLATNDQIKLELQLLSHLLGPVLAIRRPGGE